jgi:hypothetical protein
MWSLAKRESVSRISIRNVIRTNIPGSKVPLILIALELDQRREQQNHVPALVHDRTVAEGAANFAGQLVLGGFGGRVVPLEVVVAVFEVDVVFVEDGGPLERRGCKKIVSISDLHRWQCFFIFIKKNIPC